MFARSVQTAHVRAVIASGEIIARYPDDKPFPSYLILGFVLGQPLHVVVAVEATSATCYVITVYVPDPILWDDDFKRRRPS